MQLDAIAIRVQPFLAFLVERVRRAIVDDDEYFAPSVATHELLEELQERAAVEVLGESIAEACVVERDGAVHMRRLSLAECIYSRLVSDS